MPWKDSSVGNRHCRCTQTQWPHPGQQLTTTSATRALLACRRPEEALPHADLFDRREPEIGELVAGLKLCIQDYIEQLPHQQAHPLLLRRSERFNFAASLSVRLQRCGYHTIRRYCCKPDSWKRYVLPSYRQYPAWILHTFVSCEAPRVYHVTLYFSLKTLSKPVKVLPCQRSVSSSTETTNESN